MSIWASNLVANKITRNFIFEERMHSYHAFFTTVYLTALKSNDQQSHWRQLTSDRNQLQNELT